MSKQWFDVDRQGLCRQAEEQPKGRLVGELVQNALDEPGVKQIAVSLNLLPGKRLADLIEAASPYLQLSPVPRFDTGVRFTQEHGDHLGTLFTSCGKCFRTG